MLHPASPEYPKLLADIETTRLRADFLSSNKRIADRASKEIDNVKASASSNVEIVGLFSAVLSVVFTMASITAHSELKFFELAFLACSLFGLLIMIFAVFSLISGRKAVSSLDCLWYRFRLYSDCPVWSRPFNCFFNAW